MDKNDSSLFVKMTTYASPSPEVIRETWLQFQSWLVEIGYKYDNPCILISVYILFSSNSSKSGEIQLIN